MPKASFAKLNAQQLEDGKPVFANPRNAAAGSLRQLNTNVTKKRDFRHIYYTVVDSNQLGAKTHTPAIQMMAELGFNTNPTQEVCANLDESLGLYAKYEGQREDLP